MTALIALFIDPPQTIVGMPVAQRRVDINSSALMI